MKLKGKWGVVTLFRGPKIASSNMVSTFAAKLLPVVFSFLFLSEFEVS